MCWSSGRTAPNPRVRRNVKLWRNMRTKTNAQSKFRHCPGRKQFANDFLITEKKLTASPREYDQPVAVSILNRSADEQNYIYQSEDGDEYEVNRIVLDVWRGELVGQSMQMMNFFARFLRRWDEPSIDAKDTKDDLGRSLMSS